VTLQRLPASAVYALAALGLLLAAVAGAAHAGSDGPADAFQGAAAGMAGLVIVVAAVLVRPAWPLSLGVALAAFSGHWDEMNIPVPLDRVLILSGIGSALVRKWQEGRGLRTRPIDWLLIIVGGYAICSAVVAGTIDESSPRFNLLDRFSLVAFVAFYVAPFAFRELRDRQILLGTFVALGGYLGLTALIETTGPRGILLPRYIDDPLVGTHFDRARGPFAEAAANGMILYACAIAGVMGALTWRDRRLRGIAVAVAALCMLGTLLTVTRAIWIGTIAGTIVALLAARETRRFIPTVAVGGAVVVLVAFATIPGLQAQAEQRSENDRPVWARQNSNAAALRMLDEKPTFGFGWGTYRTESPNFYRQADDYPLVFIRDVHNVYLGNAVELGLVGAGLWLFALLWAIGGAVTMRGPPDLRPWKIGLLGMTCMYLVVGSTTPLSFTMPTLLLWTWAGICWVERPARQHS
jgi:putative inorganic carbon (HCO3(-)) transporter